MDGELAARHPLRILLAEDNAINQKLALLILERLGYRADVAGNGLEVIESLERATAFAPYDLILMDMQMPELDGLQATRRIRAAFPADVQPHIIAVTANAMEGDRQKYLDAGMNDYVSKPLRIEELVRALQNTPRRFGGLAQGERPATTDDRQQTTGDGRPAPAEGTQPRAVAPVAAPPRDPQSDPAIDRRALERLKSTLGTKAGALLPTLLDGFFKDAVKFQLTARRGLQDNKPEDVRRSHIEIERGELRRDTARYQMSGTRERGKERDSGRRGRHAR